MSICMLIHGDDFTYTIVPSNHSNLPNFISSKKWSKRLKKILLILHEINKNMQTTWVKMTEMIFKDDVTHCEFKNY